MAATPMSIDAIARRVKALEDRHENRVTAVFSGENMQLCVRCHSNKTNLQRGLQESVGESLGRVVKKMERQLLGEPHGGQKKRLDENGNIIKTPPPPRMDMILRTAAGEDIDGDTANERAWPTATALRAVSKEDEREWVFPVDYNPPMATTSQVEAPVFVGVPTALTTDAPADSEALWFTVPAPEASTAENKKEEKKKKKGDPKALEAPSASALLGKPGVRYVGQGAVYTPVADDAGLRLAVVLIPRSEGVDGYPLVVMVPEVRILPEDGFDRFPPALQDTARTVRVLTYNILYDGATVIYSTGKSMYPYARPDVIDISYRRAQILREVIRSDPDIFAVQEMQSSLHEKFFAPHLGRLGFDGVHLAKTSDAVREGVSLFWRTSKFQRVSAHEVKLGGEHVVAESLNAEAVPAVEPLRKYVVEDMPQVREVMEKTGTVGIIVALRDTEGRQFIVANTHLWFHPKGSHVRVAQLDILFKMCEMIGGGDARYIVCGDMNFLPGSAPHQYAVNGSIPVDHAAWAAAPAFDFHRWDFESGEVVAAEETTDDAAPTPGPALSHNLRLADSAPHLTHSNFTPGFTGRLDYIFHSDNLVTARVQPLPPNAILAAEGGGIPSSRFPSDHLPICADLAVA